MSELTLKTVKSEVEIRIQKEDIEQIAKSMFTLCEEMTLSFTPEGLFLRQMDASHVALLDISMPNACFEKYTVENDFKIAVRIDEFLKIIKIFDKNSWIDLKVKDDNLVISRKNEKYTLRLIEASENDIPLPKIPYDVKVDLDQELSTKDFIKATDKIKIFSDYLTVNTTNNYFIISGKGDSGEAENSFERGQVSITASQDSIGTYSMEYLTPFLKTIINSSLTLEYSEAKPIRLESKITNIGRIHFYLAPRVEN